MEFVGWLKRIFSVSSITLVFTALAFFIAYKAYVRESPGRMSLMIGEKEMSFSVNRVYLLTTFEDGVVDFSDFKRLPVLGNLSQQPIKDCTFILEFFSDNYFTAPGDYLMKIDSTQHPKYIEMGLKKERVSYMGGQDFPLYTIEMGENEPLMTNFLWTYIHLGMEEPIRYVVRLITVPKKLISGDGEESVLLKAVRPYLLDEDNLREVAIVYNDLVIENPRIKSLKKDDISGVKIKDLQR